MLLPGAGVGGHCIPKDPWLLIANMRNSCQAKLILAARDMNDAMPRHMVELTEKALADHGLTLYGAQVAVLGYAFREDTDDDRDSPSMYLVEELNSWGESCVHDPISTSLPLSEVLSCANVVVIMAAHYAYR